MTADDRTVQVPVSLIASAWALLSADPDNPTVRALNALLSQPTPTADRIEDVMQRNWDRRYGAAEPPRIEDMAPGTLVERDSLMADLLRRRDRKGRLSTQDVERAFGATPPVDPSTIRDVTPPKEA